jgi:branched-chain amino acid transport system permease protein
VKRQLLVFWMAIALLCAVPQIVQNPFKVYLVAQILFMAIFALSFDVLYGYTGLLSLGQSVYFGLGAYGTGLLIRHWPIAIGGMFPLAIGLATLAAGGFGLLAVRVRGHGFIIITAVTTLVMYLLGVNLTHITGGDNGLRYTVPPLLGNPSWRLNGPNPTASFYFVLPFFVLTYLTLWWLVRTPLGHALRLIRENEERAEVLGYPVQRLKLLAFVISGAFAGLAGVLYALVNGYVAPQLFRWTFAAEAIIWTLIGGAGTLLGPVVGTALLMLLQEWLKDVWRYGYPLLVGLLLILAVLFFPRGIVGTLQEHWRQWRAHRILQRG